MITIYCFKDINDEIIYIGSTKDINKRYREHKNNCYNENCRMYNYPLYQYMRDNNGFENFKFKKICDIDEEYRNITEQFYMDTFKPKCNNNNVIFDRKKYDKEYWKEYREKNREKLKEYRKENDKKYQEKNKEKINKRIRENRVCCRTCRCEIRRSHLKRHFSSQKHLNN